MDNQFKKYSDVNAQRIASLIAGFIRGTLSKAERGELDAWICASDENMQLFERLTDEKNIQEATQWMEGIQTEKALERVKQKIQFTEHRPKRLWMRLPAYAVAASIILIAGILIFKPFNKKQDSTAIVSNGAADILPGTTQASLQLENGKVIVLNNGSKDTSVNDHLKILQELGEIVYTDQATSTDMVYHTLTIPRKGQYKLLLADGTKIWMNAESSLRYPVSFDGNERKVFLTGEAYFEVAKDKEKPFRVVVNDIVVEALGTSFNINAYSNEPSVSATLVEGSILVSNGKAENILMPGQQAKISANDFTIGRIETSDVVAWKNNQFKFANAPLDEIMRQVERWYDAEVIYENMPTDHFNADIPRDVPVSKLLHFLELTKRVHFRIDNNKIIVMK